MATATRPRRSVSVKQEADTTLQHYTPQHFTRLASRMRCIPGSGTVTDWRDFRNPECLFRAKRTACGGYVQVDFSVMHDSDDGMIGLYAEDADPIDAADGVEFLRTNMTARRFTPDDLPKMAEFLHALGEACEALHQEVQRKLPAMREEAAYFAETFERLQCDREDWDKEEE